MENLGASTRQARGENAAASDSPGVFTPGRAPQDMEFAPPCEDGTVSARARNPLRDPLPVTSTTARTNNAEKRDHNL